MDSYFYIKAFHIAAFTSWMAMLFYLPRLFVYHAEHKENAGFVEVVRLQEERLYKYIGLPALVGTLFSGLFMIVLNPSVFSGGWLHAKLLIIMFLVGFHFYCGALVKKFKTQEPQQSGKFFRIINELPTLALLIIVVLAVIRPF